MDIVGCYINSLNEQIEYIESKDYKDESEKYMEVCSQYAYIVSGLSEQSGDLTLKDLLPITNVFKEYQQNYFKR